MFLLSHRVLGKFAAAAAAGGAALVATAQTARTDGDIMHPVEYPWSHNGVMHAYDAASIRRGHQVYAEVCAACHGLKRVAYRNLVGVCYTEDEAKEMAADKEYPDGPDDTGQLSHALSQYFVSMCRLFLCIHGSSKLQRSSQMSRS